MKSFKTKKGTELPLMELQGKDYLQVAYRVAWFREEHPEGRIDTERIHESTTLITYRATISIPKDHGYDKISNADKTLQIKSTKDYEKAETGAIGRALALAGYGTQFAEDIIEGEDLADAPLETSEPRKPIPPSQASTSMDRGGPAKEEPNKKPQRTPIEGPPQGWPEDECNHKWMDDKYNISKQYCYSCGSKRDKNKK